MAAADRRRIARALCPAWSAVLDDQLDDLLDIAAASVGETEYGEHYDRAVALQAAATSPALTAEQQAAMRARLADITRSRSASLPWVAM